MKIPFLVFSLIAALCLPGCSKDGSNSRRLVPNTAAELAASPDFKLEHTTQSGIQCYVRPITPDVASSISDESGDHPFLSDGPKPYLFVVVHKGKIIDLSAEETGLTTEEGFEVAGFAIKKAISEDPEMQKMLQDAGKK